MSDETAVRDLLERDRVAAVVNRLFVATDARDWPRVRECFAQSVHFDLLSSEGQWRIDLFRYRSKFVDGNLELDREPSV